MIVAGLGPQTGFKRAPAKRIEGADSVMWMRLGWMGCRPCATWFYIPGNDERSRWFWGREALRSG